jgi:hypothetical protein
MAKIDCQEAENDSFIAQLHELNERARWYSSQLWQVPFAFLGIVGITLGAFLGKGNTMTGLSFLVLGGFGIAVILHMRGLADGERRAVLNLQKIEAQLRLEQTAIYKPREVWVSFNIAIIGITVLCFFLGIYFLAVP